MIPDFDAAAAELAGITEEANFLTADEMADSAAIIAAAGPAGPVKGPYSGVSPLVRIYAAGALSDQVAPADGLNAWAAPASGALQTSGIEVHYQWRPSAALLVSQVQFYSSAPGRAIVRLYEADAATGRPGRLLAQSGFDSRTEGWQGGMFAAAVAVEAGRTYFVSYAHEKDITSYLTLDRQRDQVSFYWNDLAFGAAPEPSGTVVAPVLTRLKAYGTQLKLEWGVAASGSAAEETARYEVFRNSVLLGATSMGYYIDEPGPSAQAAVYTYTVRAVRAGQRSAFSNALTAALPAAAPQAAAQPNGTPASVPEAAGAQAPQSPADPPPGAPQNAPAPAAATPAAAASPPGAPLIERATAPPPPVRQANLHRW